MKVKKMEAKQKEISKNQNKNLSLVKVHGLCRCGIYYEASLLVSPLNFDSPNEAFEMPHIHYTMRCWKCGRLVNLVSVEKEPLKKEA
jgi:hypothetical protein